MDAATFYLIFLVSCSAYVLIKGGPPERAGIAIAIVASVLSLVVASADIAQRWEQVETGIFFVDLATFAAFLFLALRADRFWPLWITGLHLIGIATHTAKLVDSQVVPWVYANTQALWAYPILLIMVIGTARHRRRLKLYGVDNSWIDSSGRSGRPRLQPGPNG